MAEADPSLDVRADAAAKTAALANVGWLDADMTPRGQARVRRTPVYGRARCCRAVTDSLVASAEGRGASVVRVSTMELAGTIRAILDEQGTRSRSTRPLGRITLRRETAA